MNISSIDPSPVREPARLVLQRYPERGRRRQRAERRAGQRRHLRLRRNDNVDGHTGNDTLYGHDGRDRLYGYDGRDTLHPGLDTDVLYGGRDPDRFMWGTPAGMGTTVETFDVVEDFSRPDGDLLGFDGIDANELVAGNQAFTFIGTARFTRPGQIRYEDWRGDTYIYVNTDGDLGFEGGIRLAGLHAVDASWFYL
jgi:Ca2+-binding RTX toxin-like protein